MSSLQTCNYLKKIIVVSQTKSREFFALFKMLIKNCLYLNILIKKFIFEHADKELFIFEDADKNCFQTSTTSTLLATAEPAMTTTVAFAGASFDHEHGDDGQHFGDILLHLISISTKTHLQWDIERKRRRRGNYYMAPPQHCRPPPLGGCSIIMMRIYRRGPA